MQHQCSEEIYTAFIEDWHSHSLKAYIQQTVVNLVQKILLKGACK